MRGLTFLMCLVLAQGWQSCQPGSSTAETCDCPLLTSGARPSIGRLQIKPRPPPGTPLF